MLPSLHSMKKNLSLLLVSFILGASTLPAEVVVYKVDPVHSGISFKVRHFLNKVPGTFSDFEGEIHFDAENPANSKALGVVRVPSVDTRNSDRDGHLQNEDFFNAPQNPLIEFESTKWEPVGENRFKVHGNLRMAGMEKPIALDLTYLGEMEGRGKIRSGWEGSAVIDRRDWGMSYGAPAVGTEVEIELNVQAHRE